METWNREELYNDIWQQPMLRLAEKYGVSSVMLGIVCRKLSIPVPGRGYWAKKKSGHNVSVKSLPTVKNVPVIQRHKLPDPNPQEQKPAPPEPTDPEYVRIQTVETLQVAVDPSAPLHKLVVATARAYRSQKPDERGYCKTGWQEGTFALSVSGGAFERALLILNTIVLALEKEGFPVSAKRDSNRSHAVVFEQEIGFDLVEKYNQIRLQPKDRKRGIFDPKVRYEPNGILEFRVFHSGYGQSCLRDRKSAPLERNIPKILGALVREGRAAKARAEEMRRLEIARRKREIELYELSTQIKEEERKIAELDAWATNWARARQYREFIAVLEQTWKDAGSDVSDQNENAKRLTWMRQQADRLDPLIESPPSILDRKRELNRY